MLSFIYVKMTSSQRKVGTVAVDKFTKFGLHKFLEHECPLSDIYLFICYTVSNEEIRHTCFLRTLYNTGRSPLHCAVRNARQDFAEKLLQVINYDCVNFIDLKISLLLIFFLSLDRL